MLSLLRSTLGQKGIMSIAAMISTSLVFCCEKPRASGSMICARFIPNMVEKPIWVPFCHMDAPKSKNFHGHLNHEGAAERPNMPGKSASC